MTGCGKDTGRPTSITAARLGDIVVRIRIALNRAEGSLHNVFGEKGCPATEGPPKVPLVLPFDVLEIGRASCRERV